MKQFGERSSAPCVLTFSFKIANLHDATFVFVIKNNISNHGLKVFISLHSRYASSTRERDPVVPQTLDGLMNSVGSGMKQLLHLANSLACPFRSESLCWSKKAPNVPDLKPHKDKAM